MSIVRTVAPIIDSPAVAALVGTPAFGSSAARTVASWWQSPGRVGSVLAALASGRPVDVDELVADIDATAAEAEARFPLDYADARALSALRSWAVANGIDYA